MLWTYENRIFFSEILPLYKPYVKCKKIVIFFDSIQIFYLNIVIFFKTRMAPAPAPVSARSTGKKKRVVKHQKKGKDDSFQCGICLESSRRKKNSSLSLPWETSISS